MGGGSMHLNEIALHLGAHPARVREVIEQSPTRLSLARVSLIVSRAVTRDERIERLVALAASLPPEAHEIFVEVVREVSAEPDPVRRQALLASLRARLVQVQ